MKYRYLFPKIKLSVDEAGTRVYQELADSGVIASHRALSIIKSIDKFVDAKIRASMQVKAT